MVFRIDLTDEELLSIDMENLNSPWNDQFKMPESEHKAHRKRLRQEAIDNGSVQTPPADTEEEH